MTEMTLQHKPGWLALLIAGLAFAALSAGQGFIGQAHAAQAVPLIEDPAMADRLKRLEYELRCLVCQAESVAESNSEFAQDIRREVARMMQEGMTDQQIREFLVQRYGDFILFRPPVNSQTALLWGGPLLLLVIGGIVLAVIMLRRRKSAEVELTDEEHRRASALLAAARSKGEGSQ